jgi:hypothetical protein
MKTLQETVEGMIANNKDLYAWYAADKDMCVATIFLAFCKQFEVRI